MRVPPTLAPELQQALREIWQRIDRQSGPNSVDLHGRRFLNAGESKAPQDFITRAELERLLGTDEVSFIQTGGAAGSAGAVGPGTISGTHAERLVTALVKGLGFYETDRTVTYIVNETAGVLVWNYVAGSMVGVDGAWPTDLLTSDVGFLYDATDTLTRYRWSGTAWEFWGALTGPGTAPATPSSPSPATGGTGVSVTPQFAWSAALATSYDIYFGTAASPPLVSSGQAGATYSPASTLAYATRYYWKVVAINVHGSSTGAIWSFTTEAAPTAPDTPSSPSPADDATSVAILPRLTWAAARATSHDVYFGNGLFNYTVGVDQPNAAAIAEILAKDIWFGYFYSYSDKYGYDENAPENFVFVEDLPSFDMAVAAGLTMLVSIGAPVTSPIAYGDTTGHEALIIGEITSGGDQAALVTAAAAVVTARSGALSGIPVVGICDGFLPTSSIANVDWIAIEAYVETAETAAAREAAIRSCLDTVAWGANQKFIIIGHSFTSNANFAPPDAQMIAAQYIPASLAADYADILMLAYFAWRRPSGVIYNPAFPQYPDHEPDWRPIHEDIFDGIRYRDFGLANYTLPAEQPLLTPETRYGPAFHTCPDEATDGWITDVGCAVPPLLAASALSTPAWSPPRLAPDQTYQWAVIARNAYGSIGGPAWDFSTGLRGGAAPLSPTSPSPARGSTDVSVNIILTWSAVDAERCDVYFGTTTSPTLYRSNVTSSQCIPPALTPGVTYYWQIVASNAYGSTTGPLWYFTAQGGTAPGGASNPSPADSAIDVDVRPTLAWTAGLNAQWYTVLFGTTFPPTPPIYAEYIFEPRYQLPADLEYSTRYYWCIQAHNSSGRATGPVWSFLTKAAPTTKPAGPTGHNISISGTTFRAANASIWKWHGMTYFGMLRDHVNGGVDSAVYTHCRALGVNVIRVLTMKSSRGKGGKTPNSFWWAPFAPGDYSDAQLASLIEEVRDEGFYLELVALADCDPESSPVWAGLPTTANKQAHLNRICAVADAYANVFVEDWNEPYVNGLPAASTAIPLVGPSGVWITHGDAPVWTYLPPWHWVKDHTPRDAEWPRKAKHIAEYSILGDDSDPPNAPLGVPAVGDEPIGIHESVISGRSNVAQDFADYYAVADMLASGATILEQRLGLESAIPNATDEPNTMAALEAIRQVWEDVPADCQLWSYTAGHLTTCPLRHELGVTTLQVYGMISGNTAWCVRVRALTEPEERDGWRIVARYGYNGNIVKLEK